MTLRWIEPPTYTRLAVSESSIEVTLRGKVVGAITVGQAESWALANTGNIYATNHGFVFRSSIVVDKIGYDQWSVEIAYGSRTIVTGDYTFDFDTSGGTVHITQAKESVYRYSATHSESGSSSATNVPKHNGAIGVDRDEVKGTDIVIPAMRINVTFRHPLAQVTMNWAKVCEGLTGKVNSTPFLQWAAGEVLLLGARGTDGTNTDASVTYSIATSRNATGLSIGSIAGVAKKGWEYLWIKYKDDVSASSAVKLPEYAYVERVYDTADFKGTLGFG